MPSEKTFRKLRKDNITVDLSQYVYLTKAGKEWVKIIRHSEETLAKGQAQDSN